MVAINKNQQRLDLAIRLKSDCGSCAGLCCVVPAFDKGDDFAIDKPAETSCVNLAADHRCTIHQRLVSSGFSGCVTFDCNGAGQRVVHEIFAGATWRNTPKIAERQFTSFRRMRAIHEKLVLINAAGNLSLDDAQKAEQAGLLARFDPAGGWTERSLLAFNQDREVAVLTKFLMGLRNIAAKAAAPY